MAKPRPKVPAKVKALLQQEINSVCPICSNADAAHFEIHHLDSNPENNVPANLLLLCPTCHSKIEKGDISAEEVKSVKIISVMKFRNAHSSQRNSGITISGSINNSVVANAINTAKVIVMGKKKPSLGYADNAIGKDANKKNYIQHLMDRYIEYKSADIGKSKASYAVVHSMIKGEFKAGTFQIPVTQFDRLMSYLQNRIDATKIGRINKGKGVRNYTTFSEFVIKHG